MTVEWRHNKRIILISGGDNWTWDDAGILQTKLQEMLQSVNYPVQLIFYFRPEFRLPPGGFADYTRRLVQMYQDNNVPRVYYVAHSPDIFALLQAAIQRNGDDPQRHIMHDNLNDTLQRAISESSDR